MQALIFMDLLHTLGFFYIHCILEMCYKNTLAQGWGLCKAKEYLSIGMGWGGVQKWPFRGKHTLWMVPKYIKQLGN